MKTRALLFLGIGIIFLNMFVACSTAPAVPRVTNARGENANGVATGYADGYHGEVSVTLTISNGLIIDVVARADHDTPIFANPVISRAVNYMVRNNIPEIDILSGATITSTAINKAARSAFDQILVME